MSPEEKYMQLFKQMSQVCDEQGWGDPFSYARSKEIYATCVLEHKVADSFSGADAFNQNGEPVEYKSTIGKRCTEHLGRTKTIFIKRKACKISRTLL